MKASQNDRNDHNTNGVLLFAAKALEVWFTFVAGLLVYEAQMALRESESGLPANYSKIHLEFSDILNLFRIPKWISPIRKAYHSQKSQREVLNLCLFVLLAVSMTLLVNLMGPSTGVLILPSVQSIDQGHTASERFVQIHSSIPPNNYSSLGDCNDTSIADHTYSCAERLRGPELDSIISFAAASIRKNKYYSNGYDSPMFLAESQEANMQFLAFNFTYSSDHEIDEYTVPSRQTLRELSNDVEDLLNGTSYNDLVSSRLLLVNFAENTN